MSSAAVLALILRVTGFRSIQSPDVDGDMAMRIHRSMRFLVMVLVLVAVAACKHGGGY